MVPKQNGFDNERLKIAGSSKIKTALLSYTLRLKSPSTGQEIQQMGFKLLRRKFPSGLHDNSLKSGTNKCGLIDIGTMVEK